MPRIKLKIEYDGTKYVGWQSQRKGVSVQGEIEKAAKILFKKDCIIQAAGRTDAGVHALGQVAHMDIPLENKLSKKNNFANSHSISLHRRRFFDFSHCQTNRKPS